MADNVRKPIRIGTLAALSALVVTCQTGGSPTVVVDGDVHELDSAALCPDDLDFQIVYAFSTGEPPREILVLHDAILPEEKDHLFDGLPEDEVGFRVLSDDEHTAAGLDPSRTPVWIYGGGNDEPPCKAVIGRPIAIHDGEGFRTTHTGFELEPTEGCTLGKSAYRLALRADERPTCRVRRVNEAVVDVKEALDMGLPDEFRKALLPDACRAPVCLIEWRMMGTKIEQDAFYDLLITHITPDPEAEDECMWGSEDWYGVFSKNSASPTLTLLEGAEGLYAVAHDSRGLRGAIMSEDGRVSVFHVEGTAAPRLGRNFAWSIPHDEERTRHSLSESCL